MSIPLERIRARRREAPEDAQLDYPMDEAIHRMHSIEARLCSLRYIIETYSPEAKPTDDPEVDPDPARNWDFWRRILWPVVDLFQKRGKVPARLAPVVAEIRARLAALSKYPVIPGTPWAEIRTILAKTAIFRSDAPEG
jgi:hypothetical protein